MLGKKPGFELCLKICDLHSLPTDVNLSFLSTSKSMKSKCSVARIGFLPGLGLGAKLPVSLYLYTSADGISAHFYSIDSIDLFHDVDYSVSTFLKINDAILNVKR